MQIETEVKDNPDSRSVAWHFTPDHGVDEWQYGRISLKRGDPYKIVITAQRSDAALGYVAIDDFGFGEFSSECKLMPKEALPTTTTPTPPSTPIPKPIEDCSFEDIDYCGWNIDEELNVTDRFHFQRRNGEENDAFTFKPDSDHNGDKKGTAKTIYYFPDMV